MGFFIASAAGVLVVLQTTLLLLDREPLTTTFTLVRKQTAINGTGLWSRTTPVHIEQVLSHWQPHVLLLAITCVHCIIALQTYKSKTEGIMATARSLAPQGLFFLWLTVALLVAYTQEMVEVSTWVAGSFLFAAAGFVQQRRLLDAAAGPDLLWSLIFQLQAVSVPLSVLLMANAGVRAYTDIAVHFLVLSAAVNSLWLQLVLHGSALYMAKLLTVAIPSISLYLSQVGMPSEHHVPAAMGSIIALAPLFIMPVILNTDDPTLRVGETLDKFQLRLGSLCCTGALICTIVNLASV